MDRWHFPNDIHLSGVLLYMTTDCHYQEFVISYQFVGTTPLINLQYATIELTHHHQWTLFITHSRLLFYFMFRTCSICFHTTYRLQVVLGM